MDVVQYTANEVKEVVRSVLIDVGKLRKYDEGGESLDDFFKRIIPVPKEHPRLESRVAAHWRDGERLLDGHVSRQQSSTCCFGNYNAVVGHPSRSIWTPHTVE